MKRLLALVTAVAFAIVLPTLAAAKSHHSGTPHISGTITSWDDATKEGKIKESSGTEKSFTWNDKTEVSGTPKVGEHASVSYTKENGKMMATHIHIGAKTASTKTAPAK